VCPCLQDTPDNPWKFQNSSLFGRLDSFLERCHDMTDLMATALQFNRLERVEIGGTKGKVLTNGVKAIHADFTAAIERFQQVRAAPLPEPARVMRLAATWSSAGACSAL
jgi:dynein heavy chain